MGRGCQLNTGTCLGQNRTGRRLNSNRDDFLALRILDVTAHSSDRSSSAYTRDKNINLAICIFPNFRPSCFFMDGWIGRIFKLLKQNVFWVTCRDFFSFRNGSLHAFGAFSQNQFGTISQQKLSSLDAHRFRHRQGDGNSSRCCNESQSNACVSTGWLNNLFAFAKQSF